MNFKNFLPSLAQSLSEFLETKEFKRMADDSFVRFKSSHEINIISIQKHSAESAVSINFGVHYDFLPKLGSTEVSHEGQIELPDCEIKVRVTPEPSAKDFWWPIAPESIEDIVVLINSCSESFFNRYNIKGDISSITPDDLSRSIPDSLAMLTKVRACLLLARIHETSGNKENALRFAELGIKAAGLAVGPKKALKEVLKRVST